MNSKNKCICLINNLEGYNKKDFDIQTQINHEQMISRSFTQGKSDFKCKSGSEFFYNHKTRTHR